MQKQIIFTRVLEFGGNNTYLKTLINYFGKENVIIVLKKQEEIIYIDKIDPSKTIKVLFMPGIREEVKFKEKNFIHNLKEIWLVLKIFRRLFMLSYKYNFAGISISSIEPEKYLYFFWLPFIKINYILHSEPLLASSNFTRFTCNLKLGKRKKIITVSNFNKNKLITQWGIKKSKVKYINVIYNCLPISNKVSIPFSNINIPQTVLTLGHVENYKNPEVWLKVARRVTVLRKDVTFYWLGNGQLLGKYQDQVKNENNICFMGLIEKPNRYFKCATIYYQPSLSETQGIAVIEAMSNHLPCIVTNAGGLPESVINNQNGFVVNITNVEEHVSKILQLLDNQSLCTSFGEQSYIIFKELFLFDTFVKNMNKIYKQ